MTADGKAHIPQRNNAIGKRLRYAPEGDERLRHPAELRTNLIANRLNLCRLHAEGGGDVNLAGRDVLPGLCDLITHGRGDNSLVDVVFDDADRTGGQAKRLGLAAWELVLHQQIEGSDDTDVDALDH